jgi:chromosome segregation ATPase
MMDYEFTIHYLERELAHYKEMQQWIKSHVEAHDRSIETLDSRMDRAESALENAAANIKELSALVMVIGEKLSAFIDSLRAGRDGKENL